MKEEKKTKVVVVQESTAEAFQNSLNKALAGIESPRIDFNFALGHCAYITYEATEKIAESAEDEYRAVMGEYAHCGDCPYLEKNLDKRVKWHSCRYNEMPVKVTSCACEMYYKRLLRGGLND